MTSSIDSLLTNYKTDKLDELIFDEIQFHGYNCNKINVFNKKTKAPLQKIWVRMPLVKVFRPTMKLIKNNAKSIPLSVMIAPNTGDIRKFYLFVRRMEIKTKEHLLKLNLKNKIKSSLKRKNPFPPIFTIKMPCKKNEDNDCYEFLFHIYNNYNKRISLDYIESGDFVTAYLELSEIWITEKNYGFNWNVLQLKVSPKFNFNQCLFLDEDIPIKVIQEECYHCLYCPNSHVRTHHCTDPHNHQIHNVGPPPPPSHGPTTGPPIQQSINRSRSANTKLNNGANNINNISFVPSVNDLKNIMLKLKHVEKNINSSQKHQKHKKRNENEDEITIKKTKQKLKSTKFG